jgi:hypothetical protein
MSGHAKGGTASALLFSLAVQQIADQRRAIGAFGAGFACA